jgi:hypothetical protein
MTKLNIKSYRAGEPGTLGAVCKAYFDKPMQEGCPFQRVCCIDNGAVEERITLHIIRSVDAETLAAMAKAVRATKIGCRRRKR